MTPRVLVTGAGGFIGSHVVDLLLKQDIELTALCRYSSTGDFGWLESERHTQASNLNRVLGDITDTEFMRTLVQGKDVVVNLAALIGIPYSFVAPRAYLDVNIGGVFNILEATKGTDTRLVQISTSEVYGTPQTVPIELSHPISPQSPYAATKSAADQLCMSYAKTFGSKILVIRPFNTFGPRQSKRAIIPTILTQLASGANVVRVGSTSPKRDFTFVEDTAQAIVTACFEGTPDGHTVQLGTGRSISISDVLNICKGLIRSDFEIEVDDSRIRPKLSEVDILESNPISAFNELGWAAKTSLEEGLLKTYSWLENQGPEGAKSQKYAI